MRYPFMEGLGKLIAQQLGHKGSARRGLEAAGVIAASTTAMAEVFGVLAPQMKPVSFKRGVLKISCAHSTCSEELRWREDELLSSIAKRLGPGVVTRVAVG
jgi:predicted nucleic acid-binding Zn ribbon protein